MSDRNSSSNTSERDDMRDANDDELSCGSSCDDHNTDEIVPEVLPAARTAPLTPSFHNEAVSSLNSARGADPNNDGMEVVVVVTYASFISSSSFENVVERIAETTIEAPPPLNRYEDFAEHQEEHWLSDRCQFFLDTINAIEKILEDDWDHRRCHSNTSTTRASSG
jgi:hypothetical protein